MIKSTLKVALSLLIVIALVIAGVRIIQQKKAAMESIPPAKTYGMVVPVRKADVSTVRLTVPYLALVRSDNDVDIASKVTSRVDSIVASGTRVRSGDVLVKLDAADLVAKRRALVLKVREVNNQIDAERTDLKSLEKTHERNRALLKIKAISEDKFDTETARIESLRSTIESMKNNAASLRQNIAELKDTLSYTTITSPLNGVVSNTYVANGGIASSGKPLLSLSGGSNKQLIVRVSDNVKPSALLHSGSLCPLHSLDSTYNGLHEYSCQTDTVLPAGARVEVKLVVYTGQHILLPSDAVLQINGKSYVLLVHGDQATAKPVTILAEGSEGLIVDDINVGDRYVVARPDILLKLLTGVRVIKDRA